MWHLTGDEGYGFLKSFLFPDGTHIDLSGRDGCTIHTVAYRCKTMEQFLPHSTAGIAHGCQYFPVCRVHDVRQPQHIGMGRMAGYHVEGLDDVPCDKGIFRDLLSDPEEVIQGVCRSHCMGGRTDPTYPLCDACSIPGVTVEKYALKSPEEHA